MSDDPAEIAKAWQEAYRDATGKHPPCVEVQHIWIRIESAWHCADEVRERTEKLRRQTKPAGCDPCGYPECGCCDSPPLVK